MGRECVSEARLGCGAGVCTPLQGLPGPRGQGGGAQGVGGAGAPGPRVGGWGLGPLALAWTRARTAQRVRTLSSVPALLCQWLLGPQAPDPSGGWAKDVGCHFIVSWWLVREVTEAGTAASPQSCFSASLTPLWPSRAALPWGSGAPAPSIPEQSAASFPNSGSCCVSVLHPSEAVAGLASLWPHVALVSAGGCGAEAMSAQGGGLWPEGKGAMGGSWPMGASRGACREGTLVLLK